MGYIAKAYVRIKNLEQRRQCKDQVFKTRGTFLGNYPCDEYIFISADICETLPLRKNFSPMKDFIDCNAYTPNGTEEEAIKLFLELAKMQGDVYREWNKVTTGKNRGVIFDPKKSFISGSARVLTPLEVAEAFRDGRIEL